MKQKTEKRLNNLIELLKDYRFAIKELRSDEDYAFNYFYDTLTWKLPNPTSDLTPIVDEVRIVLATEAAERPPKDCSDDVWEWMDEVRRWSKAAFVELALHPVAEDPSDFFARVQPELEDLLTNEFPSSPLRPVFEKLLKFWNLMHELEAVLWTELNDDTVVAMTLRRSLTQWARWALDFLNVNPPMQVVSPRSWRIAKAMRGVLRIQTGMRSKLVAEMEQIGFLD